MVRRKKKLSAYHFLFLKTDLASVQQERRKKVRISSSQIGMDSARNCHFEKKESTRVRYGELMQKDLLSSEDDMQLNREVENHEIDSFQKVFSGNKAGNSRKLSSAIDEFRQQCIRYIFELLFAGRKRNRHTKAEGRDASMEDWMQEPVEITRETNGNSVMAVETFDFRKEIVSSGQETAKFFAGGIVLTADGRNLEIQLEVEMSRRFTSYYQEHYTMETVQVCDPLILNFDGNAADLTEQKFYFDLDADGEKEKVSMPGAGSGYLAFDQNHDGRIGDGSELFGTGSGDGFEDLEKYDTDGNGWIDEEDTVFDRLKIWCKGMDGEDILYTLKEKNIGAICLQRADTEFSLKDPTNHQTEGYIRKTGIFLYENGLAGTVQHVDVAKGFQVLA